MNDSRFFVRFADYPFAFGTPSLHGVLRSAPADFFVEEQLGFAPDGDGPHVMLWIEKTGANTEWVARQLAKRVRCRPMDVGFSGMKDRHAVTRQWFSVPAPKADIDWQAIDIEGVQVLEAHAHRRKLRRGAHRANRFVLTLRDVSGEDDLDERAEQVRMRGVPNYFGPQRFGREGDNVARAVDGARGGVYLSAARSFLFNAVLAERVRRGDWNVLLPGEAVQLDGSGSFFVAEENDADLQRRLDEFDIHPSGPLWGKGELPSRDDAAALETGIANAMPELRDLLEKTGMRQERRALRLPVRELDVERADVNTVILRFALPPGAFATSVLREMINVTDRGESDA
ncbi:MAG TPA: tRNA pseudouridine(13) synthase TruD [Gammaproteobacteria bacterium]